MTNFVNKLFIYRANAVGVPQKIGAFLVQIVLQINYFADTFALFVEIAVRI